MARKEATLEQWAGLYERVMALTELEPWEILESDRVIAIADKDGSGDVYCSVRGHSARELCGVRIFMNSGGLEDLDMILEAERQGMRQARYACAQMSCLEFAYMDREEVFPAQRARIKALGLKYRGRGCWPVFASRKRRYAPCDLDADEVEQMCFALENLVMVVRGLREQGMVDEVKPGDMILRYYDEEDRLWYTGAMPRIWSVRKYPIIEITDELLKRKLQKAEKNRMEILMDFVYLNQAMHLETGGRPVNPLILQAVDRATGMILCAEMVSIEDDEADAVMDFFLSYVDQFGCMRSITARNKRIHAALELVAKDCKIRLIEGNDKNMRPLDVAADKMLERFGC